MRRTTRLVILSLLFGTLSTLSVAWVCEILSHFSRPLAWHVTDSEAEAIGWLWPMTSAWPEPNFVTLHAGIGSEQLTVRREEPVPPARMTPNMHPVWSPYSTSRERSGFPMLAFETRSIRPQPPEELAQLRGGFLSVWRWRFDNGHWVTIGNSDVYELPLRPIWPGFLINTLLFTALWAAALPLPRLLRNSIRRANGLCICCRYPVSELERCPECGTDVRRKST